MNKHANTDKVHVGITDAGKLIFVRNPETKEIFYSSASSAAIESIGESNPQHNLIIELFKVKDGC